MKNLEDLIAGYKRFKCDHFAASRARYRALAQHGQSPGVMIIGCCDSRVDPAAIFDAGPGELFVVRNVANLVPPYEPDRGHHGTSAAIEFAVTGLGVGHILVLGHAACGGVKALMDGIGTAEDDPRMIARWMSIARPVYDGLKKVGMDMASEATCEAMEKFSVIHSIANLRSFPFVGEAEDAGRLSLHGAWFGIEAGRLELLHDGVFTPVES
jgi:carbonic anhydrase